MNIHEAVETAKYVVPDTVIEYGERIKEHTAQQRNRLRLTADEEAIRDLFNAHNSGRPLIDARKAILSGGLDENNWPRLALARLKDHDVEVRRRGTLAEFGKMIENNNRWLRWNIWLTVEGFERSTFLSKVKAAVAVRPTIPLELRGKTGGDWLLFEALKWTKTKVQPDRRPLEADPFILLHIRGPVFAITGTFDLTKREVEALAASRFEDA